MTITCCCSCCSSAIVHAQLQMNNKNIIQQKQQQQQPPTPHQGRHQKGPAPRAPPPDERREVRDVRNVAPANHHHHYHQQQRRHIERERDREREREPPGGGREKHARMSPGISPTSSQPETYATPNMSTPLSSPPSPRTEMANQINEQIIAQQNEELPPDEVPTKRVRVSMGCMGL